MGLMRSLGRMVGRIGRSEFFAVWCEMVGCVGLKPVLMLGFYRYSQADEDCQTMYREHEKQQKRLRQIRIEINELQEQI